MSTNKDLSISQKRQEDIAELFKSFDVLMGSEEMRDFANKLTNCGIDSYIDFNILSFPPTEKLREIKDLLRESFTFFENFEIDELSKNIRKWVCASLSYDEHNTYNCTIDICSPYSIFYITFGFLPGYQYDDSFPFSYEYIVKTLKKLRKMYAVWINKNFRINMSENILKAEDIRTINNEVENFWTQLMRADPTNFELFDSIIQDLISTICRPLFFNIEGMLLK